MQMVILCGGFATRLGNLTKNIPKSMIDIEGKPFLEYQIENLKNQSIDNIILCVGHLSNKIEEFFGDGNKFGVRIQYSYDGDKALGPFGALKNAESLLENVFFIMYGDSYLTVDFKEVGSYFKTQNKIGLMVVYKNFNKYDKSNILIKDNKVIGYGEKDKTEDMIFIDYGTSIFNKNVLEFIPEDTFYETGQLFSELVNRNELLAFEVKNRFYHIGNPDALKEFREYIRSQ
jgi:NDP-sugar pyrophosphorylase family protein